MHLRCFSMNLVKSFRKVFYRKKPRLTSSSIINPALKKSIFRVFLVYILLILNKEIYRVNSRIQFKCKKIQTRQTGWTHFIQLNILVFAGMSKNQTSTSVKNVVLKLRSIGDKTSNGSSGTTRLPYLIV